MGSLFGTDGIRGRSGSFPIDENGARKIGFAIGQALPANGRRARSVAIGRDTRKSGAALQRELCRGLSSAGARIVSAGVCPTPAVVSLVFKERADAGIMVSASHNPPEYNGFKIFNREGMKIPESSEMEIQKNFEKLTDLPPPPDCRTGFPETSQWKENYFRSVASSASEERDFSGIKAAIDCANGAMFEIAPEIFNKAGAKVVSIGTKPDGENINKGCGSLHTAPLGEQVRQSGAAFGAALDGDGDRVAFCDEKGIEVDGDAIIALFSKDMMETGALKKPAVAATVMSNKGLEIFLEQIGISLLRTDVGDRNVADAMKKRYLNFGGEKSGHLIFSNYSTNGDGLLASVLLADIVKRKNMPLSKIVPQFELFPQILKNVPVFAREPFEKIPGLSETVEALEKQLGKSGRVHIRYSGTEPLARILVEGENESAVSVTAGEIAAIIEKKIGAESKGAGME